MPRTEVPVTMGRRVLSFEDAVASPPDAREKGMLAIVIVATRVAKKVTRIREGRKVSCLREVIFRRVCVDI